MAAREALLYRTLDDGRLRCDLCEHRCVLSEGAVGLCGVRRVKDGRLWTDVYGTAAALALDPIEKKPFRHFLPGSRTLAVATVGCNFRCSYCQNYDVSQYVRDGGDGIPGEVASADEVVEKALAAGADSLCFTYSEPTIFYEYARDVARAGAAKGLRSVFKTNGFMTPEMLEDLGPLLSAANVDLKGFDDETYRLMLGGRLAPVLDAILAMKKRGTWVELTTLLVPGENDSEEEIRDMATWIAGVDRSIPWHVSRFHPDYKMMDHAPTPIATLFRAWEIGREAGLRYVYVGLPGNDTEHTVCPGCGEVVISRFGYKLLSNRLRGGRCPSCDTAIEGVWS